MDNKIIIRMHFELSDSTEQEKISQLIQERLSQLDSVSKTKAIPEEPRTGVAEIAAAIAVTVLLIKSSRELIEELRKFIQELKGLIVDCQELGEVLKEVWIEVGDERLSLEQVEQQSDEELKASIK